MGEANFRKPPPESDGQCLDAVLGELLDRCGHYFAHRIGGSRRGRSNIMELLAQKPGITQKELAEVLGVKPASVSELLIKLERKGLVKREKAAQDRRSVCVTLTEAGQEHLDRPKEALTAPFQALSEQEQAQLAELLRKLLRDWQQRCPAEPAGRSRHQKRSAACQHGGKIDELEEKHGF